MFARPLPDRPRPVGRRGAAEEVPRKAHQGRVARIGQSRAAAKLELPNAVADGKNCAVKCSYADSATNLLAIPKAFFTIYVYFHAVRNLQV